MMRCLERKRSAEGIMDGIMLSKREKAPVICVTGKHLTPHKIYDRFIIVIPENAYLIDEEYYDDEEVLYWEINGVTYVMRTIYFGGKDEIEKVVVERLRR